MNIYVGNLPHQATEDEVRQAFEAFGQVSSVSLIKDKMTGQPRGFGFVEMATEAEAKAAIEGLNGKDLGGRALTVNEARPREERPREDRPRGGGFRGGGGGGGFRGGGGGGRPHGDREGRGGDRGGDRGGHGGGGRRRS